MNYEESTKARAASAAEAPIARELLARLSARLPEHAPALEALRDLHETLCARAGAPLEISRAIILPGEPEPAAPDGDPLAAAHDIGAELLRRLALATHNDSEAAELLTALAALHRAAADRVQEPLLILRIIVSPDALNVV